MCEGGGVVIMAGTMATSPAGRAEPPYTQSTERRLPGLGLHIQREMRETTTLHRQVGVEIHISDRGEATFLSEGMALPQYARSVVLIRGKRAHQVVAKPSAPYQRTVLCVDDTAARAKSESILGFGWLPEEPCNLRLDPREYAAISELCSQLLAEQALRGQDWEQLATSLAVNVVVRLRRIISSGGGSAGTRRPSDLVNYATEHVERHLASDLALEKVARHFRVSPEHLTRSFQRHLGVPFHRYVISQRIAAAKRMLEQEPDVSLTEIALSLGFSSSSAFSRCFRQFTHRSPSEHRLLASDAA